MSSEPPTKTLLSVGNSESPGLKISIEIEKFKRGRNFQARLRISIFGPLGFPYFSVRTSGFFLIPSDRNIFSTFVRGYQNTAIAE